MKQQPKFKCKYTALECFISVATDGGCRHRREHYKDSKCDVTYCNRVGKNKAYCKPVKGQENE